MSLYDDLPLSELDRKARDVFGVDVVVKSLTQQTAFHGLPRYVAEYLIAKYVQPESWRDDLTKVQTKIRDLLPDLERRELVKDRLLRTGEIVLLDAVEARVDLRGGQRWSRVPAINDDKVRVPAAILEQHVGLLLGGLWGTVRLRYTPETDASAPNEIVSFTPFQIGPPDVEAYRTHRAQFTTDEWLELILQSAGYAPAAFPNRRQRLLLLTRLVPLVERNVNLIELGPRQTGKTFLLRNTSPRVFTISGGKTTPANLFVNLATRAVGILGTRKVIVFDEIAHTTFGDEEATISTLKDFMESGQFSRGSKSFAADASLVFAGNLDVEGDRPDPRYRHLFEPLPAQLIDSAFLDRIHGYLPGWEVPKITPAALAQGVGFVTDYFGEVLVRLREEDMQPLVNQLEFQPGMTQRDSVAVRRLASGLLKLLYPHGKPTDEELHEVVTLASELRQRVHNQLVEIAPGEFKPRLIGHAGMTEHAAADLRTGGRDVLPQDDRLNREAVVGAVTGLAVVERAGSSVGGDLMLIQVSAFAGHGRVEVTGLHGRVMSDSVRTAYNVVQSRFRDFGIVEKRLQQQVVAVHLVRIAEPREGPSAGLAFVVGIVSALTGRPVKPACAMTGEVTLHGEVTSVGGVELKVRAAVKAGRKLVLIPAENAKEITRMPEEVLKQVQVVPVQTIVEALNLVLEPTPEAPAPNASPS
ncbi:MAG TPA: BREX system Lon protease-like protein BrxL [Gemmataceae bacterium]|nr:BREX system Lon protease-like protein BrxL [Gemmataceae bacterium]